MPSSPRFRFISQGHYVLLHENKMDICCCMLYHCSSETGDENRVEEISPNYPSSENSLHGKCSFDVCCVAQREEK